MPQIIYSIGDLVWIDDTHIAIIMSDSRYFYPPIDVNGGNLPFIRTDITSDKIFPVSKYELNKLSDEDKRLIATALCAMGFDIDWIKNRKSGIREK